MNEKDVGVAYSVPADSSLQDVDTVTMTVRDPKGNATSLPMTVGNTPLLNKNGNQVADAYFWAYRITQITDFPMSGEYQCQLITITGSSQDIASKIFTQYVGPRIGV